MKTLFKLALITGATSGIGEALAKLIESKGIETILVGRRAEKLQPFKGKKLVMDLSQDRQALIELIRERAPDLVINNAGFGLYGEAASLSVAEQAEMVELNVQALQEITLEAAKALKEKQMSGTIMNISSAASFQPLANFAVYAATKAYVSSLSQSLDEELTPYNIRVLTSCPGFVQTEFSKRASKTESKRPRPGSMTLDFAVNQIWQQIETGKRLVIFDWKMRLMTRFGQFFVPNWLITKMMKNLIK